MTVKYCSQQHSRLPRSLGWESAASMISRRLLLDLANYNLHTVRLSEMIEKDLHNDIIDYPEVWKLPRLEIGCRYGLAFIKSLSFLPSFLEKICSSSGNFYELWEEELN